MMRYLRATVERGDASRGLAGAEGEAGSAIRFTASTPGVKRDGKDLAVEDWYLENYRKNPVVLWAHDYRGENLPIGRADVWIEPGRLVADVMFDQADEFAKLVERKYRSRFLHSVSVGWDVVTRDQDTGEIISVDLWNNEKLPDEVLYDLLDISAVPVPGDPEALMERQVAGLRMLCDRMAVVLGELDTEGTEGEITTDGEIHDGDASRGLAGAAIGGLAGAGVEGRRALPVHRTEMAEEGASWDGPGEVGKAEGAAQLRGMHAWEDASRGLAGAAIEGLAGAGGGGLVGAGYELPHHRASGEVVWAGVAAGMVCLLQATTQIPDADRGGVYRHLEAHYQQFGKVAPEYRSVEYLSAMGPGLRAGLFLEGEVELWPGLFAEEGDASHGLAGARGGAGAADNQANDYTEEYLDEQLVALHRLFYPEEYGDE